MSNKMLLSSRKILWGLIQREEINDIQEVNYRKVLVSTSPITTQYIKGKRKEDNRVKLQRRKRRLSEIEKEYMVTELFLPSNGLMYHKEIIQYRNSVPSMKEIIDVQVKQFIERLHKYIAEGRLVVDNIGVYEQWMKNHHAHLFEFYFSDKLTKIRNKNLKLIEQNKEPIHRS